MLSNRMEDYYFVSQGKTRIPGVSDYEEFEITDVSLLFFAKSFIPYIFKNAFRLNIKVSKTHFSY